MSLEGGRFSSCTTGNEHRRFWLYVFTEGAAKQNSTSKFHVVRVKKSDPGFTLDPESYSEVSLIQRMSISVDGRSVVVPRSAFTDLFNVRKAWLIVERASLYFPLEGLTVLTFTWPVLTLIQGWSTEGLLTPALSICSRKSPSFTDPRGLGHS